MTLPALKADSSPGAAGDVFTLLRRPAVALGMAAVGLFFMGQFMLFTYLRPFLETVTNTRASTLSFVLLVIGVAGFVGTAVIGTFLKTASTGRWSSFRC